jgi:RimJ/RimL family protein N-acetyltransferase
MAGAKIDLHQGLESLSSTRCRTGRQRKAIAASFRFMERFATKRLIAEKLCEDHLAHLVALHLDPDVSRYLGGVRSPEATEAYLAASMAHWEQHGFGIWALRTHAGEFAGRAGIRRTAVEGAPEFEIVYALKRDLWGRGFASEIASALTEIARSRLRLPSLVGLVVVGNDASCRVLEKFNFTRGRTMLSRGEQVAVYRSPDYRAVPIITGSTD